ncbi:RDD family protein [Luteimonas sp. R10]|uniref:RDD family protein n=1 Tax=Luteimonas sp. R10 TaxID=3108176 RepID=UPI003084AAA1|nr:RDD family protein [Luteimonas sp. R10]
MTAPAAAGFWQRYAAWSLDAALVAAPVLLFGWRRLATGGPRIAEAFAGLADAVATAMLDALAAPGAVLTAWLQLTADPRLQAGAGALTDAIVAALGPQLAAFVVLGLLYHVACEAAPWQATLGKRVLGLRVADAAGQRASPARALLRHLAGALSWLTLNLGHLLAALPPQRRALHDRIAGAMVLQAGAAASRPPRWARAWIAAQAVAGAAAALWLLAAMQAVLQAAVERALG